MNEVINADAIFESVFEEELDVEIPFDIKDDVRIKKSLLKNYKDVKELTYKEGRKKICKIGRVVEKDGSGNLKVDFWSSTPARIVVPFSDLEIVTKASEREDVAAKDTPSGVVDKTVISNKNEAGAKPSRYNQGSIEVWDAIDGMDLDYLQGNVIKYTARYKHKNGEEDLCKAMNYLIKILSIYTGQDYYELRDRTISEITGG